MIFKEKKIKLDICGNFKIEEKV